MGDLIRDSFTQFYQSITASYQVLNENRTHIEDRKSQMLRLLETGIQIPEPPKGTGEYQQLCRETINTAKLQLQSWQQLIRGQIERSEFVNRHEKSILALVFADVNAGKSTLGNFVGGWYLQDTPYADLYIPHDCEVETYSAASTEDRGKKIIPFFTENATEATSTIQHYTLQQGLTWVDTPGLHSLTTEHGDLAKEYIQFADLVVYLTPSSSPFKSDEREMLGDLFRMGKPVILAITKSDVTQHDVVNGRITNVQLPKSDENRKKQEVFVSQQVREISGNDNLENSHILSLSVRLARDAVKAGDGALYAASNLDKFLSQMGSILSSKAIELKMRRPKAEINTFIDRLAGRDGQQDASFLTISQLRTELKEKSGNLQMLLDECERTKGAICADIERMLPVSLSPLFRSLRDRKLLGDKECVRKEMTENVSRLVAEQCRKHLLDKLGSIPISVNLPRLKIENASGTEYKIEYASQVITRQVERDPKGWGEHIVRFFDKDKKFYKLVQDAEKIAVADNFNAYLDAQIGSLGPDVRKLVSATIDQMAAACISPLLECYQELDRQLEQLTNELANLRFAG